MARRFRRDVLPLLAVIGIFPAYLRARENPVFIDGPRLPVRDLNFADFGWVPNAHPVGSVVQSEDFIGKVIYRVASGARKR